MTLTRRFIGVLILVGLILSGCSENVKGEWQISPTFTKDNMTLHGVKGKFGIIKVNGKGNEPEFLADEGRLYHVYFLEKNFNGGNYEITATHKNTDKTIKLYEGKIEDKQSGAKLSFGKAGLWRIDVTVDDKPYTSFFVDVQ